MGLAKKVLIANTVGELWSNISGAGGFPACRYRVDWHSGVYFSDILDFSGYRIWQSAWKMFGFEFLENFDYPYMSKSITEFRRRWHISLGTWFRDYVYILWEATAKGFRNRYATS